MYYKEITVWTTASSYLSELLDLYNPSRSLRSSSDTRMLKPQRFNRKTYGFHLSSRFGPQISFFLKDIKSKDIMHFATLSSFENKIITFLFFKYLN